MVTANERRKARELALMMLYQADLARVGAELGIERFFESFVGGEPLDRGLTPEDEVAEPAPSADTKRFAERLVRGVLAEQAQLDAEIQRVSSNWRIDRMARVDRNLLRLGAYELMFMSEEVPKKVVINEAVEIAKRFGTAESFAFVNGVLDRIQPPPKA